MLQATILSTRTDCHALVIGGYAVSHFPSLGLADAAAERINVALARGDKAAAASELTDARSLRRFMLATR